MSDTIQPEFSSGVKIPENAPQATAVPNAASPPSSPPVPSDFGEFPEEILNEWRWIFQARERGDFDPYRGQHVAVLEGKILGSGYDPQLLRELLALKHHLDPKRIVTVYAGNW